MLKIHPCAIVGRSINDDRHFRMTDERSETNIGPGLGSIDDYLAIEEELSSHLPEHFSSADGMPGIEAIFYLKKKSPNDSVRNTAIYQTIWKKAHTYFSGEKSIEDEHVKKALSAALTHSKHHYIFALNDIFTGEVGSFSNILEVKEPDDSSIEISGEQKAVDFLMSSAREMEEQMQEDDAFFQESGREFDSLMSAAE